MKVWLAIFVLLPVSLLGQEKYLPGYILDNNQNKKFGKIQVLNPELSHTKCRYILDNESNVRESSPGEISGYRFLDGRGFASVRLYRDGSMERFFMQQLVYREFALFRMQDEYYVAKGDSTLTMMTLKHHEAELRQLFAACSGLANNLKFFRFSERTLKELIHEFNDCLVKGPSTNARSRSKSRFEFGLYSGVELTALTCSSNEPTAWFLTYKPLPEQSMQYGIQVRYHMPLRVTLETGLVIKPKHFRAARMSNQTMNSAEFEFSYTEYQIPVSVQYAIAGRNSWSLYGDVGLLFPTISGVTSSGRIEQIEGGIVTTTLGQPISNVSKNLQYKAGLCSYFALSEKLDAFLNTSVYFGQGSVEVADATPYQVPAEWLALNVSIGIVYR